SRAEYRLRLREDNADLRLTETGMQLGVVGRERAGAFRARCADVEALRDALRSIMVFPNSDLAGHIEQATGEIVGREQPLLVLLRRPGVSLPALSGAVDGLPALDGAAAQQIEIEVKYEGYIRRQDDEIEKVRRHAAIALPPDFRFDDVPGLSHELRQKLASARPETLARAARIPGMTPAALSLLLVHARRAAAPAPTAGAEPNIEQANGG
ncbi:MAG: tRNA uridine-5-carboxymethylaminomethyl(34) synthesis enzyme MnmG, partial [Gammaproteobacteria bacterium]